MMLLGWQSFTAPLMILHTRQKLFGGNEKMNDILLGSIDGLLICLLCSTELTGEYTKSVVQVQMSTELPSEL